MSREPIHDSRPSSTDEGDDRTDTSSQQNIREAHVRVSEADFDTMGIAELVSIWRTAGLQDFETLACQETGAVVQVDVESRLDASRLSALESIERWERVANVGESHRYVIEFTAPKFPPSVANREDDVIDTCDLEMDDHGITVSLVGPHESISATIREYTAAGLSPSLRKFGPYSGPRKPLDSLTTRQREVLETAHDIGYYEVPRAATLEAVAAELDIDESTVAEHVQRAERNLFAQYLPADQFPNSLR